MHNRAPFSAPSLPSPSRAALNKLSSTGSDSRSAVAGASPTSTLHTSMAGTSGVAAAGGGLLGSSNSKLFEVEDIGFVETHTYEQQEAEEAAAAEAAVEGAAAAAAALQAAPQAAALAQG